MPETLKWARNVALSSFGTYSVETIFGRYQAVRTQCGKVERIGCAFRAPVTAKAAAQADCSARAATQEGAGR